MNRYLEAFLEMMAAEKGAARNTLAAYRADLEDLLAFLAARGSDILTASLADLGLSERTRRAGWRACGASPNSCCAKPSARTIRPGCSHPPRRGQGCRRT